MLCCVSDTSGSTPFVRLHRPNSAGWLHPMAVICIITRGRFCRPEETHRGGNQWGGHRPPVTPALNFKRR